MNTQKSDLRPSDVPQFLSEIFGTSAETSFQQQEILDNKGFQIIKFQQYQSGIKVEHGLIKAVVKNNQVIAFTSEYYILDNAATSAGLSEDAALQKALTHIGAEQYSWEYVLSLGSNLLVQQTYDEFFPKGELVYVDDYATPEVDLSLAYKFNIYAAKPISRAYVYVDANNGNILLEDAIIKHVTEEAPKPQPQPAYLNGIGDTRYAGRRQFDSSQDTDGNFILKGVTPSGVENETLSYEGIGGLPLSVPALETFAVPIADGDGDLLNPETADNIWNASEHRKDEFSTLNPYPLANEKNNDDVALDAHWGAEVVLDYWKDVHNRLSYDNQGTKIFNYVHYGDAYDNAFWNGTAMTYGDGSYQGGTNPDGSFAPLTSMDVCAHEIGHGVCEFTSNLVYQRESGAMNEGLSDIWAASVENYVLTRIDSSLEFDTWGIGEQIDESDGGLPAGDPDSRALRWMDAPKTEGNPDCYGGDNWTDPECGTPNLANDQCGVHNNSGVLNKWYYLMVAGSGQTLSPGFGKPAVEDQITDAGNSYSVEGIGFSKAEAITYMAETLLSPNAKFAEMRDASIFAAQSLYGIDSFEEQQVTNAWFGVDVGEAYNSGEPNTISFSDSNVTIFSEDNTETGCDDFVIYEVVISSVDVNPTATISLNLSGSTAMQGEDFEISATDLTFSGSERKTIEIKVFDDAVIEDTENITLSFVYKNEFQQQVFRIADNDFEPRTGSTVETLLTEDFSGNGLPQQWSIKTITEGSNSWSVNGDLTAAGRAYVNDSLVNIPFYNQASPSEVILQTGLINAMGYQDVNVSFDWEAGGETDAVDPTIIFDYGEFVYTFDGANYQSLQKFVGSGPLAVSIENGQFSGLIPELEGKSFYLGWRWYNDANAGSEFSFAIDNVTVTAMPAGIATEIGKTMTTNVSAGTTVYFMANSDKSLIAKISNATEDLGCVTLSIEESGNGFEVFSNINTARASKVFSINTENENASYDLSIYYTDEELSSFDQPLELLPIKVDAATIDEADESLKNFELNGSVTEVNSEDAYKVYTGTFTGSGKVGLAQDFQYCFAAPSPWKSAAIGNGSGKTCYDDAIFSLEASGAGLNARSDSFYYTYQDVSADVTIVASLDALSKEELQNEATLQIRENLQAGSKFAAISIEADPLSGASEFRFAYRKSSGGNISFGNYTLASLPEYFRLEQSGNLVTASYSVDQNNWTEIGSVRLKFSSKTAGIGSNVNATFSEVSIIEGNGKTQEADEKNLTKLDEGNEAPVNDSRKLTLYPNPAVSQINLELEESPISMVSIYSLNGKMVRSEKAEKSGASMRIDVSRLLSGLYIAKIYTEDGKVYNRRFLKK
ncbi:MAG: M4 family metallopeptidase [Christiangramia sp.]|uniref:M4 family metallopeptidase n=1 Tax=Christiangramia sp. TaxID=1931228 RepID=UPI003241C03D